MSGLRVPVVEKPASSVKSAEDVNKALQSVCKLEDALLKRGIYVREPANPLSMSVGFIADGSGTIDRDMINHLRERRQYLQHLANLFLYIRVPAPTNVSDGDWDRIKRRAIREVLEWDWQRYTRSLGVKTEFPNCSKPLELIDATFEINKNPSQIEIQLLAEYLNWPVTRVMTRYSQNHQRTWAHTLVSSMINKDMPYSAMMVKFVQETKDKEKASLASVYDAVAKDIPGDGS